MSRLFPIPVTAGGKLLTQPTVSLDNVGDANYSLKINLRRSLDQEIRREGWVKFVPNPLQPVNQQYIFDGALLLNRIAEVIRPNGDRVIVAASPTTIKKYDTATSTWIVIGSGFSALGVRWQVVTINGYLILNNAVDLLVYFRVENPAVLPIYELREVGVASCGRISEYNGFLYLGDVVEIDGNQLNTFMFGYTNYVAGSTVAKNVNFAIVAGDSGKQFNVTTGASAIVATLPSPVAAPTFWCWIKKVDAAAGTVTTLPVLADQLVSLVNQNDIALVWSDGTQYFAKVFALGVIPAPNPYGAPPADIVQEIVDEVAWSDFGNPTNWSPVFNVYMAGAGAVLTLPFASKIFVAGQTRVAVLQGGANGDTLGGQTDSPNGVLVTGVSGNQITLAKSTDASITYPRFVQVLRFADTSTFVGKQRLGNGSKITAMASLQGQLIIYQNDGYIFLSRYTGVVTSPFAIREKYKGKNVPKYGDCVISVNGDFHLYPGLGNRFYAFDGLTEPQIHKTCDAARDTFFSGLLETDPCWAIDNPLTKEIWFCRPGSVMAYDYEYDTVSKIDAQIDAASFAIRPGATDQWFVLGLQNKVYTYGLVTGVTPIATWLRDGGPSVPQLKSGLLVLGDPMNEKYLLNYTPVLASPSPDVLMTVQLYETYNPSVAPAALMNPVATLPDPWGNNFISLAFQALYFQDLITVTDTRDVDFRLSARLIEYDRVVAGGVTRSV